MSPTGQQEGHSIPRGVVSHPLDRNERVRDKLPDAALRFLVLFGAVRISWVTPAPLTFTDIDQRTPKPFAKESQRSGPAVATSPARMATKGLRGLTLRRPVTPSVTSARSATSLIGWTCWLVVWRALAVLVGLQTARTYS